MRQFIANSLLATAALCGLPQIAAAQSAPSPYTTGHRYDAAGRETGSIAPDPDGAGPLNFAAVRYTYDAAGRVVKLESGELAVWQPDNIAPAAWTGFTIHKTVETSYDALDRKLTETVKGTGGVASSQVQYSYDPLGQLQCTAVRMNPATYGSPPANACTLGAPGSQGADRITKNVYNSAGQLLQVRKGVGTSVEIADATYSYTLNGKQAQIVDANGNRAELRYDGFDRQIRWVFPSTARPAAFNASTPSNAISTAGALNESDFEQYGYDANGNRISLRKRDGSVITFGYDNLNRVTVKTVPERAGLAATHTRDVYFGYDQRGLMTSARFDSATGEGVTTSYDGFGRILSSTLTMDGASRTLTYQYDIGGNRTRVTFPDGNFATYSYDGLDRPLTILRSGTATVASYTYDAAGRRTAFNGGVSTSYGYDAAGRLNSLTNNLPATTYNNQWTFAYNPASQITQTVRSNDTFAWTAHVNVDRPYATNGLNQYSTAGPATFGYDLNGNLTSDGSTTFLYDIENRLVSASGAKTAALRYDPMGRLYEVTGSSGTVRFLYDGDALVGEYNTTGNLLRRYVHGADAKADDPIAWYEGAAFDATSERRLRPDWLGSIVLVTDSTGATVLAVNRYDEYGIPQNTNAGRFQYTGQAWIAELGMYYYKARIYSPTLGRFLQTDPIGYEDQVNLYAYVGNDPVNRVDPSGEYQRGTGFTDKEWERFNKTQQKEAARQESMASKLDAKAVKLDAKTPGGGDLKRAAAANLRTNAAGLRNTSSTAATANIYTPKQYAAFNRPEGSQAHTTADRRTTNFLRGGIGIFGNGPLSTSWIIGHEGFHTIGLNDQRGPNCAIAYKGADEVNTDALNAIRGTLKATINPDSLLNGDN